MQPIGHLWLPIEAGQVNNRAVCTGPWQAAKISDQASGKLQATANKLCLACVTSWAVREHTEHEMP